MDKTIKELAADVEAAVLEMELAKEAAYEANLADSQARSELSNAKNELDRASKCLNAALTKLVT